MDQEISFEIESAIETYSSSSSHHRPQGRAPKRTYPPQNVEKKMWICDTQRATEDRLNQLSDAPVVELKLRDRPIYDIIRDLQARIRDVLNKKVKIRVDPNYQSKCNLGLGCRDFYRGACRCRHSHSDFYIRDFLSVAYCIDLEPIDTPEDSWGVVTADDSMHLHADPDNLGYHLIFSINAGMSQHILVRLLRETLPQFFGGRLGLDRIGRVGQSDSFQWCPGPVCYTVAHCKSAAKILTECGNRFHSLSVSTLTRIVRTFTVANKIDHHKKGERPDRRQAQHAPAPVTEPARPKLPREPRPVRARTVVAVAPVSVVNAFASLVVEDDEQDEQ